MPRGKMKPGALRPDIVPFIYRRRGPRRPTIGQTHRERMMAYAEGERIRATYPEATVHRELTRRRLVDGIHFDFQSSMLGGRIDLGGAVVDFLFLDRPIALRVQGEFWHQPFSAMGQGVNDEDQKLQLELRGYTVLDLWESTILNRDQLEDFLVRHIDTQVVVRGAEWQR